MDPVKETIKVYDKFANSWAKDQLDISLLENLFKEFTSVLNGEKF